MSGNIIKDAFGNMRPRVSLGALLRKQERSSPGTKLKIRESVQVELVTKPKK